MNTGPLSEPVAIVGASLAGLRAAQELRRQGFTGKLAIIGDEIHKPYDRPPLSKELLRGEWSDGQADLRIDEAELNAEWRLGVRAIALDAGTRELTFADGSREKFAGGIIVATGAAPRTLPGMPLKGVHCLRSREDVAALREDLRPGSKVVIIGGGFIGQEVAASCRVMGLEVTLIEAVAPAAHVVGMEIARKIADIHREEGVDVRLGVAVKRLKGGDRLKSVELSDNSSVEADVAVVGIGVAPNTDWLAGSGLRIDDGIVCDEACRAAPGIVACGDIARWPNGRYGENRRVEHWDNAVRMGAHAARTLLSDFNSAASGEPFRPVPWFWSDQYGFKMQLVGSAFGYEEVRIVEEDGRRLLALFRKGNRLVAAFVIGNTKKLLRYRRGLEGSVEWNEAIRSAEVERSQQP